MKLFIWYFWCQSGKPYKRTSALSRKASNCRSDSSLDSSQNNSSVHKKKSKKGFVKNLHNNNISQNDDKSCLQKIRDFYEKRSSYSFFYFAEDSGYKDNPKINPKSSINYISRTRRFCKHLTSQDWFDFFILTFIAANCITLAVERPTIPPW